MKKKRQLKTKHFFFNILVVVLLSLFLFPRSAYAEGVAINGCYRGSSHGSYFSVYCGTPAQMAKDAVDDMNSFSYPDGRNFTLTTYGFKNGTDHSEFSVNVIACSFSNGCWGTGNNYGLWCPDGYRIYDTHSGVCAPDGPFAPKTNGPQCKNDSILPRFGNPCNAATGNKYESETDYAGSGPFPLIFQRNYNSILTEQSSNGKPLKTNWRNTYDRSLLLTEGSITTIVARRPDGKVFNFTLNNGEFKSDTDVTDRLEQVPTGWTYTMRDGTVEKYGSNSALLSITSPTGLTQKLSYNENGKVSSVTDDFGNTLQLTYDANDNLATLTTPTNQTIHYTYNATNLERVDYPDNTTKLYHYENPNFPRHLTGISYVDSEGVAKRYATFAYDANGKAISTEHAGGMERFTFSYDSATQTTVRDASNKEQVLTFLTAMGIQNIVSSSNQSDGKSLTQLFDENNNLICKKNEEGRITTFSYNSTNQKTTMTEGLTGTCTSPQNTSVTKTTTFTYISPLLNVLTSIESPSVLSGQTKKILLTYDDNRFSTLPTEIKELGYTPSGSTIEKKINLTYNAHGQIISLDGARTDSNDTTTFTYYDCTTGGRCGQMQTVTNSVGQVIHFEAFDANGRVLELTDPNGLKTNYQYDEQGRVKEIKQTPPTGSVRTTSYAYTPAGDIASIHLSGGQSLTYTYSDARVLEKIQNNLGEIKTYTYDQKGNRTGESTINSDNSLAKQIAFAYDSRNYVTTINAAGSITQQVHDALGNETSEIDPNNNPPTQHTYDPLNRLQETMDSLNGSTTYQYNTQNQLIEVKTPNNVITNYSYDDLGNMLQEISPDRGTTTYTYDSAGNVKTKTDARNSTTTYTYDELNRLTSKKYSTSGIMGFLAGLLAASADDVTYAYDTCIFGKGQLCQVTDASGTTNYDYDAFGNIITQTHTELGRTYITRYTYDASNQILSLTYPDNRIITYTRDALARIQSVTATGSGGGQTIMTQRNYQADNLVTTQTFGNGIIETRTYDLQGRLTTQTLGTTDTRQYTYDANSNLIKSQSSSQTGQYIYNALDVLTRDQITSSPSSSLKFTYDGNGNRTKRGKTVYQYTLNSNRLNMVDTTTLTYDPIGNLTKYGTKDYHYNDAGQLQQVLDTSTVKGTYTYNYQSQRTRKVTNNTTVFHYDLFGNLILETNQNGNVKKVYVYADTTPIAQITKSGSTETLTHIHTDHQETPRLATNNNKTVVWRWEGRAFGENNPKQDPDGDGNNTSIPLRFAGQYDDNESGLLYNWHRYYDPKLGRYITSDPIGLAGGLNPYHYGNSNPFRWNDPSGLIEKCIREWIDKWIPIARDWKTVGYKEKPLGDSIAGTILEILAERTPGGFFIATRIPLLEDIQLERKFLIPYDVCYDECGNETFRQEVPDSQKATDDFRENYFPQSGIKEGPRQLELPFMPERPMMKDRWFFEIKAATKKK